MNMRLTSSERMPDPGRASHGFSLIELLVVISIILIITAIAIPNFIRSRIAADEASAAEHIRAITTAATVYNSTWGNGYPPSLSALGGTSLAATCDKALLLDPLITTAPFVKAGYTFSYTGTGPTVPTGPGCSSPGYNAYVATAVPVTVGNTGQRSFCSTLPGVIHFDPSGGVIGSSAACDALQAMQ